VGRRTRISRTTARGRRQRLALSQEDGMGSNIAVSS
jgi:hypothetical protein